MKLDDSPSPKWYTRPATQRIIWICFILLVLIEGWIAVAVRKNDFNSHITFGDNFLAGRPYSRPGNIYPLPRSMWDALPASMNYYAARLTFYLLGVFSVSATLWMWLKITRVSRQVPASQLLPIVTVALLVMLPFQLRDLDECGLQTHLLLLLSAAAFALFHRRHAWGGLALAAAAVYKATPILFLPFLLWKRQWRAASWMAVFTVVLSVLPALHLGWNGMVSAHRLWLERSMTIMTQTPDAYPSLAPDIEPPKPQNLSLSALLARYIETYPAEHPLHLSHPLFFQFGNLPTVQAKWLVKALLLGLGLLLAWRMRQTWSQSHDDRFPREWALVCLFTALLSPVCWQQHLVLALPCVFLVTWDVMTSPRRLWGRIVVLSVVAAVIWLSRHGVVGRENAVLLMSYKLDTMVLLLVGWSAIHRFQRTTIESTAPRAARAPARAA